MSTFPPELLLQDLHFGFPGQAPLFQGWSARLAPGLTALCGEESCGKTTLLRLLAGELQGRGRIALDGAPPQPGDVFWQHPRAEPDGTVASDYLAAQARRWPRWDEAAAQAHVEGLSLREHLHKPFFALSTGGRRKVWLAAALASGARLTLIDEPVAGLDTPSVRYLSSALEQATTTQPGRWLLVAHWTPFPELPQVRVLRLDQTA